MGLFTFVPYDTLGASEDFFGFYLRIYSATNNPRTSYTSFIESFLTPFFLVFRTHVLVSFLPTI